ncbi:hypothetical protein CBER1_10140 [Cercospora berteroae]|uniref:Uncharacterized protein n=1 Tax=Cercospora berteroae TaxID=357750 RepID=A0A2S6CJV5_9PEZI|nr:hypothetical protein CBER1_10140 [Cercospora berteroae]
MRTGILAASFAALLAIAYGSPTGLQSDASDKHVNAIRAVDDANLDTLEHMNTDFSLEDTNPTYIQVKNNFTGAPPCGDGWAVPGGHVLMKWDIDDARASAQKGDKFSKGSKHKVCGYQYVVCLRVPNEAKQQDTGFWEIARWTGGPKDGTLKYWQETIVFNTDGGSAKIYPAHGSVWACAKGKMNWWYEDDKYWLPGNSRNKADYEHNTPIRQPSWGGPCHCGFNLNTDMELSITKWGFSVEMWMGGVLRERRGWEWWIMRVCL